jgi:Domain of unknown function (DUF4194)
MNLPTELEGETPIPRFLLRQQPPAVEVPPSASKTLQSHEGDESDFNDIAADSEEPIASGASLFAGDTGTVKADTRRVLVALLNGPSVDGHRQQRLWTVLVRDRRDIVSRLHDLFLDLVIDFDQKVAFVRQVAGDEAEDIPILLRRHQLTFIESALVLYLRQRLTEADSVDQRAVVSSQDMLDQLAIYERSKNTDGVRFDRQCVAAIEKVKTLNLLRPIRNSDGRFEISPTLKLLFNAEDIQALLQVYEGLSKPREMNDTEAIERALSNDFRVANEPETGRE